MDLLQRIPIFPLGIVLLPGMNLPLHVFEERYKQMIAECMDEDKVFGIIFYDGANIKVVGCTARIKEVTKRYSDGRLDIMTIGEQRFEIEEVYQEQAYMEARIIPFNDNDTDDPQVTAEIIEEATELLNEIAALTKNKTEMFSPDLLNPRDLSFILAASEGFTATEKQQFLEMQSTTERLVKGVDALKRMVERIKINQQIKKIVGGNGHMPELFR